MNSEVSKVWRFNCLLE